MGYPCTTCGIVYEQAWQAAVCNHIVGAEGKGFTMKSDGVPPTERKYEGREPPRREPMNRVRLEEGLEREQGSTHGELGGYARERGRTEIIKEILDRTRGRLECEYGSGLCIIGILSSDLDSPTTGLNKCLKAAQIGETQTHWGRKRRLSRTGCLESGYSLFTKSWNCKYADGKSHE